MIVVRLGRGIGLLKTFDAKFWGVVVMGGAVIILFFLPWLDHSPVKSIRYRPGWHKSSTPCSSSFFLVLGYLGVQPPSPIGDRVSQVGTLFYFGFFLLMPWWSRLGEFKPVPERVTFAAALSRRAQHDEKTHPLPAAALGIAAARRPQRRRLAWDTLPPRS